MQITQVAGLHMFLGVENHPEESWGDKSQPRGGSGTQGGSNSEAEETAVDSYFLLCLIYG